MCQFSLTFQFKWNYIFNKTSILKLLFTHFVIFFQFRFAVAGLSKSLGLQRTVFLGPKSVPAAPQMFSSPSVCRPDLKSGRQRHFFPFLSFPSLPISHVLSMWFIFHFISFLFFSAFFFPILIPIFSFLVFALCLKRGQDVLAELFSMSEVGMQLGRRPTVHVCNLFYRKEKLGNSQVTWFWFLFQPGLDCQVNSPLGDGVQTAKYSMSVSNGKTKISFDLLRLWEIEM